MFCHTIMSVFSSAQIWLDQPTSSWATHWNARDILTENTLAEKKWKTVIAKENTIILSNVPQQLNSTKLLCIVAGLIRVDELKHRSRVGETSRSGAGPGGTHSLCTASCLTFSLPSTRCLTFTPRDGHPKIDCSLTHDHAHVQALCELIKIHTHTCSDTRFTSHFSHPPSRYL